MAKCRHKIGFLFLRDCGNEARIQCNLCNLTVCDEHTKFLGNLTVCPECYLEHNSDEAMEDEDIRHKKEYDSYYRKTNYTPYCYYHERDYRTFDKNNIDQRPSDVSDAAGVLYAKDFLDS